MKLPTEVIKKRSLKLLRPLWGCMDMIAFTERSAHIDLCFSSPHYFDSNSRTDVIDSLNYIVVVVTTCAIRLKEDLVYARLVLFDDTEKVFQNCTNCEPVLGTTVK